MTRTEARVFSPRLSASTTRIRTLLAPITPHLRYLERARTKWLVSPGFTLTALECEHGAVFVVHRLDIEYRQPARAHSGAGCRKDA
jgi:hypothetical protein